MRFGVQRLGFGVWGLGFRVEGFASPVSGSDPGSRVPDFGLREASRASESDPASPVGGQFGFRLSGVEFRVSVFGFRVSGSGFRVQDGDVSGSGVSVSQFSGFGVRVLSFGSRVSLFGSGFGLQTSVFGFLSRVVGFQDSGFERPRAEASPAPRARAPPRGPDLYCMADVSGPPRETVTSLVWGLGFQVLRRSPKLSPS